jgi:hypothetical protein
MFILFIKMDYFNALTLQFTLTVICSRAPNYTKNLQCLRYFSSLGYLCFNFTLVQFKMPIQKLFLFVLFNFESIIPRKAQKSSKITLSLIKLKMTLGI